MLAQFLLPTRRVQCIMQGIHDAPHFNWRFYPMTPIEEAIVEKLRESGSCCLDDVVTSLPNSSWERSLPPLIGCRGTGGWCCTNAVTRPIRFPSAPSFPTQ